MPVSIPPSITSSQSFPLKVCMLLGRAINLVLPTAYWGVLRKGELAKGTAPSKLCARFRLSQPQYRWRAESQSERQSFNCWAWFCKDLPFWGALRSVGFWDNKTWLQYNQSHHKGAQTSPSTNWIHHQLPCTHAHTLSPSAYSRLKAKQNVLGLAR